MTNPKMVVLAAAVLSLGTLNASAILITASNAGGNTGTDNVLFNSIVQDATNPIQGTVSANPGFIVEFNSTDLLTADGGQATLAAADGAYTDLTISLANGATFTKLILNPIASADGTIDFDVNYNLGGQLYEQSFSLTKNGNNFFQIVAGAGETINFVTYSSTNSTFTNSGQFRIGGLAAPTSVPDGGATVALLGTALAGLAAARRYFTKI